VAPIAARKSGANPLRLLKRIRAARAWVQLLSRFRQGDFAGASRWAERYRKLGATNAMFEPLDATLDILNFRSDDARAKFERAIAANPRPSSDDQKYIQLYSLCFLCLIEKKEQCDDMRCKALALNPSDRVRRILPLPEEPVEP
jgi:hypothetical protein